MNTKPSSRLTLLMGSMSLIAASHASAQLTWDSNNTAADQTNGAGAWLNTNQWWNGATNQDWVSGSDAIFGGPNTAAGAVTLASPTSVGSLTFDQFTGTYTLGTAGQAITLNGGITKNTESGTVSIISPIILGGTQSWTNNSGTMNVTGGTDLNGNPLTITGSGTTSFAVTANIISGSGGITKTGSGLLTFGSGGTVPAHTYSGDTNLNGGVAMFANNYSANSNININGGILESYWSTGITQTLGAGANQIRITGGESGFSLNGNTGVTVNLGGGAITWGTTNFDPSKFVLQSAFSQSNSNITFANALNLNGATRTILVNGGTTGAARAIISGAISNSTGTAGLTKEGAGMLNLTNGTSAWNGNTTVSAGVLDMGGINLANIGGGSGRNITVADGAGIRFNTVSNAVLNRIAENSNEIGILSGGTSNSFDFSSSTGANLPNAFLGNWAGNGAKAEFSGTITFGGDNYNLGAKGGSGALGIVGTNKLTGTQGLVVGQTGASGQRVVLAGANDFSGNTVIRSGNKLTLGNNLAIQNSALNLGSAGGSFALNNSGTITGSSVASSPTFGGLIGSRNLFSAFTNAGGNNESNLANTAVTGFTLNVGSGKSHAYSGAIGGFGTGATGGNGGNSTLTKTGEGTQILSGTSTYTGATVVSMGTLFVNGALGNSAVTVEDGGAIGGNGALGGTLAFDAGGMLDLTGASLLSDGTSSNILNVTGNLTLTSFAFSDIIGWDWLNASEGTYTLINGGGTVTFDGSTPTVNNQFNFGNGKSGYFQQGSLQAVIVIPEPHTALLGALGLLALMRRKR